MRKAIFTTLIAAPLLFINIEMSSSPFSFTLMSSQANAANQQVVKPKRVKQVPTKPKKTPKKPTKKPKPLKKNIPTTAKGGITKKFNNKSSKNASRIPPRGSGTNRSAKPRPGPTSGLRDKFNGASGAGIKKPFNDAVGKPPKSSKDGYSSPKLDYTP